MGISDAQGHSAFRPIACRAGAPDFRHSRFRQDEAAQPADAAGVDKIVVTPTCRSDALPGVPIAISAVSSEPTRFAGAIDGS
jgi:hypothetical protein